MAYFIPEMNAQFLHIPKTGGCWVLEALERAGMRPRPMQAPEAHIRHATPKYITDRRYLYSGSFCFTRDPIDWYVSWWRYSQDAKGGGVATTNLWFPQKGTTNPNHRNFNDWMEQMLEDCPGFASRMFNLYSSYCHYSVVGRTERLNYDLLEIINQFGVELTDAQLKAILSTPPQNQSVVGNPTWDEQLLRAVVVVEEKQRMLYEKST